MTDETSKRRFYEGFAGNFEQHCIREKDEHWQAMHAFSGFSQQLGVESILDVGAGTGRGRRQFAEWRAGIEVISLEPQPAMIQSANLSGLNGLWINGNGKHLPLQDKSVDATVCFGILHHDRDPAAIVKEMARISRKAVFISDSNRFAQGSIIGRRLKVLLHVLGLWPLVNWIKTGGKGYAFSPVDGLIFSFSPFDILSAFGEEWQVYLSPTQVSPAGSVLSPQLEWANMTVVAVRKSSLNYHPEANK